MSWERDLARAVVDISAMHARATRAYGRGNVSEVLEDGRAVVELPNGAKIIARPTPGFEFSTQQSVSLRRGGWEATNASPWQGGKGAPFDES